MVRIVKKNATKTLNTEVPTEETWHDLECSVFGLAMVLSNLDEEIKEQICENGEAVVNLAFVPAGLLREFFLDVLHKRFWNRDDDFADSRRAFLSKVGERKRLKIRMTPLEGTEPDGEDGEREWNLTLYAGNSRLATCPMTGFWARADFHAVCWLFHRNGTRVREMSGTLETVLPGFHDCFEGNERSVLALAMSKST